MARAPPMEDAAMPVRPAHHWRNCHASRSCRWSSSCRILADTLSAAKTSASSI
jgi:hypothetical protein